MGNFLQNLSERFDDAVRHRGVLGRHEWLRNLLRKPYHRLVNFHGRGLPVNLGGHVMARLPPEYASKLMEHHECSEFEQIKKWCGANPGGLFVDVGCSQGYMSCAALFSSPTVEVVGVDSDASSLKCACRVCCYGGVERLHLIRAMVSRESQRALKWREVEKETSVLLDSVKGGDPGSHQYITLDNAAAGQGIPRHALDDLLADEIAAGRKMLVKCDVEGGEFEVVSGAARLMRESGTSFVLSVHPTYLPKLGSSVEALRKLLDDRGYEVVWLATDHEEHWLCRPKGTK